MYDIAVKSEKKLNVGVTLHGVYSSRQPHGLWNNVNKCVWGSTVKQSTQRYEQKK